MNTTNEALLSSIFNVSRLIRQKLFSHKCFCNLSHSEMEVLMFLTHNGKSKMRTISDHLKIKPSSATPTIERMFKKGVLKRNSDKNDRRATYIEVTKKGVKEVSKIHKEIKNHISEVFGKLNNKDKKTLIKILEKIHAKNI
jgi:MarR family 2-MHQ and catechol resistance regulon transcriptional repressor